jgi:phospholipid/cholesterol/gamma-HCH transport system substrate-binding protein
METRARYALIGLFMLAIIVASFGFVYWLENKGGFSQRESYRVRFGSSVSGLLVGSAVLFNGIRVGEVTGLALDPAQPEQVVATIAVARGTPVRSDTFVGLESQGLTGGAAVTLTGGDAAAPPLAPGEGGEPAVLTTEPGATQDWSSVARSVLSKLDTILSDNADNLHSAIANFNTFTDVLAKNSDRIDGILGGVERMTGGGATKTDIPVYDISAAKDFPALTAPPSWQLVVPEPSALLAVNSDKVRVRPTAAPETTDLPNAKWTDNAPILLQEKIIQSFENAGYSSAVSRPRDGFEAGFQLVLDIRNFSLATAGDPTAELEFVAKVLGPNGKIIAARTFQGTAPATGNDAPAAAAALNEAFAKIAHDLVPWAADAINNAPPPPPAPPTAEAPLPDVEPPSPEPPAAEPPSP